MDAQQIIDIVSEEMEKKYDTTKLEKEINKNIQKKNIVERRLKI